MEKLSRTKRLEGQRANTTLETNKQVTPVNNINTNNSYNFQQQATIPSPVQQEPKAFVNQNNDVFNDILKEAKQYSIDQGVRNHQDTQVNILNQMHANTFNTTSVPTYDIPKVEVPVMPNIDTFVVPTIERVTAVESQFNNTDDQNVGIVNPFQPLEQGTPIGFEETSNKNPISMNIFDNLESVAPVINTNIELNDIFATAPIVEQQTQQSKVMSPFGPSSQPIVDADKVFEETVRNEAKNIFNSNNPANIESTLNSILDSENNTDAVNESVENVSFVTGKLSTVTNNDFTTSISGSSIESGMDNAMKEKIMAETKQIQIRIQEYENELQDGATPNYTNKIMNIVLVVLILFISVALIFLIYWILNVQGII